MPAGTVMRALLFLSFFFLLPYAAYAEGLNAYQPFITAACQRWDVPEKLVRAIARQESGHNPWAVNVSGKSYMPASKAEALDVANTAYRQGRSFDVGLMQINSYWLRRFGFSPEYVIEPERNIIIGVWILSKEIERFGLGWKAVASYHTPVEKNPERGKRYALSVIHHLRRLP